MKHQDKPALYFVFSEIADKVPSIIVFIPMLFTHKLFGSLLVTDHTDMLCLVSDEILETEG